MDASTLQRRQDIMASQSLDSMLMVHTKPEKEQQEEEKKARPAEDALKCPRCDSTNTKFCYYNNYSLTQPRYFCKSCRRYWTKGGTLRNVPVGGGCRKNKRCSRRTTPEHHLHSLISSPRSQDYLLTPLTSYDHYNGNGNNGNGIPVSGYSGNNNNHHFDLFGNQFNGNLLNSLYYGNNLGNLDNNINIGVNHDEELHHQMGMHFDLLHLQNHQEIMSNASSGASTPTPTIKQEFGDNNRALFMNYIINNGGNAEIDAPKESWNGVLASSWHNLINSPLM